MVAESAGGPAQSARLGGPDGERYARLVWADGEAILASFVSRLEAFGSPLGHDPAARSTVLAEAAIVIDAVAISVAVGDVRIDGPVEERPWVWSDPESPTLTDWTDAAAMLTDVALMYFARHVADDHTLLPSFMIAVMALNQSVARRSRTAADAFAQNAAHRLYRAHRDERRRIARELHDRLGESLSVGLRRLDLQEIAAWPGADHEDNGANLARDVLVDAMTRLRRVTSDLRAAPIPNLEKALTEYLDSVPAEAGVELGLQVEGDEERVPATVRDEVFLILREAVRNALAHGAPGTVLVSVDLTGDDLTATVQDDGCGFQAGPGTIGTGLVSMYERAVLIGGRLTVHSGPGAGARVELRVPLPEPVLPPDLPPAAAFQ